MISISAFPSFLNQVHDVHMPPNQLGYCTMLVFVVYSAVLCSTYLLITMTFERFYSIIRPLKAASFNTVKRARIIIVCVFFSCFSYCIPFLFITGVNGRTCVPNRFASESILGILYHWFSQIVLFIFPFLSLLIMNSSIIHILRQRSKQKI